MHTLQQNHASVAAQLFPCGSTTTYRNKTTQIRAHVATTQITAHVKVQQPTYQSSTTHMSKPSRAHVKAELNT